MAALLSVSVSHDETTLHILSSLVVILCGFFILGILPNKAYRIVKRYYRGSLVTYHVQQRHDMFRWWWVEPWVNMIDGIYYSNKEHRSVEEAQEEINSLTQKYKQTVVV